MQTLKQADSDIVTLVAPSGGVTVDVPVKIGNLVVIPEITAAEGALFSGRTRGVFKLPKTASLALTAGRWVVWDVSAGKVDLLPDSTADFNLGRVRVDAASSDTEVEVVLTGAARRFEIVKVRIADVSAAADSDTGVAPFAGLITRVKHQLQGAITAADAVITPKIGSTAITGAAMTIANAGSAAGVVDSAFPTAANVVAEDDSLVMSSGGESSTSAAGDGYFVIEEL
jgi:predicted RecA/RadA family phage recombinase